MAMAELSVGDTTVILGIETSCDETAAAVLLGPHDVASSVVSTQIDLHARYGGVVPEIASRAHLEMLGPVIDEALDIAGVGPERIDAVAATVGPGLIGALLIGVSTAKALSLAWDVPFVGVNHMEAHLYAAFLEQPDLELPLVVLLVSGGHTMLVEMRGHGDYQILGSTIDDAAGEAFDKVARLLGLPFPGGPAIDDMAREGDPASIDFPRGLLHDEKHRHDFSFSGVKTAVSRWLRAKEQSGQPVPVADVAAAFQESVADVLSTKAIRACRDEGIEHLIVGGGVAANSRLRAMVEDRAAEHGIEVRIPPPRLCTDNGAMVASLGAAIVERGLPPSSRVLAADSSLPVTEVLLG